LKPFASEGGSGEENVFDLFLGFESQQGESLFSFVGHLTASRLAEFEFWNGND